MGSTAAPSAQAAPYDDPHSMENGKLLDIELLWRNHYQVLKDNGYTLRPRYNPDWVASWLGSSKDWMTCEDGAPISSGQVLDATRADGSLVILKRINVSRFPHEMTIGKHFSSEPLASNTKNHCVPILDVIHPSESSDIAFIVMPFLLDTEFAPFETIGEAVEFFRQIFEGLQFMHENNVVHGDCKYDNIMADTLRLFNPPPHPTRPTMKRDFSGRTTKPATRTTKPVKYYLLDFDLSILYPPEAPHLEAPPWGGDKTVPEFLIPDAPPCDPFPVDVYCMGNAIKQNFLDGWEHRAKAKKVRLSTSALSRAQPYKKGFEFMRELISDMVNEDPQKRPTMTEVVSRFDDISKGLSIRKLRSPVVNVDDSLGAFRSIAHWTKQTFYIARRLPAIPKA